MTAAKLVCRDRGQISSSKKTWHLC